MYSSSSTFLNEEKRRLGALLATYVTLTPESVNMSYIDSFLLGDIPVSSSAVARLRKCSDRGVSLPVSGLTHELVFVDRNCFLCCYNCRQFQLSFPGRMSNVQSSSFRQKLPSRQRPCVIFGAIGGTRRLEKSFAASPLISSSKVTLFIITLIKDASSVSDAFVSRSRKSSPASIKVSEAKRALGVFAVFALSGLTHVVYFRYSQILNRVYCRHVVF